MVKLLPLPNGNLIDPRLIHAVIQVPGKGVMIRNEFNKPMDFLAYPDPIDQLVIVRVLGQIVSSRNWDRPDWEAEFAKARKEAELAQQ